MPLHAKTESCRWILDGLDDAVWSGAAHLKSGCERLHRLVVPAVDLKRIRIAETLAHQFRQQRILLEPDFMREVVRLVGWHHLLVLERSGHLRRDVLDERSAGSDVEDLNPPADCQDWQAAFPRFQNERNLEIVALRGDNLHRRMFFLAVPRWRDIVAARQQQTVHSLQG